MLTVMLYEGVIVPLCMPEMLGYGLAGFSVSKIASEPWHLQLELHFEFVPQSSPGFLPSQETSALQIVALQIPVSEQVPS